MRRCEGEPADRISALAPGCSLAAQAATWRASASIDRPITSSLAGRRASPRLSGWFRAIVGLRTRSLFATAVTAERDKGPTTMSCSSCACANLFSTSLLPSPVSITVTSKPLRSRSYAAMKPARSSSAAGPREAERSGSSRPMWWTLPSDGAGAVAAGMSCGVPVAGLVVMGASGAPLPSYAVISGTATANVTGSGAGGLGGTGSGVGGGSALVLDSIGAHNCPGASQGVLQALSMPVAAQTSSNFTLLASI